MKFMGIDIRSSILSGYDVFMIYFDVKKSRSPHKLRAIEEVEAEMKRRGIYDVVMSCLEVYKDAKAKKLDPGVPSCDPPRIFAMEHFLQATGSETFFYPRTSIPRIDGRA